MVGLELSREIWLLELAVWAHHQIEPTMLEDERKATAPDPAVVCPYLNLTWRILTCCSPDDERDWWGVRGTKRRAMVGEHSRVDLETRNVEEAAKEEASGDY